MSEYTAQEWQRDGTSVYALNIEGTNRFIAQVQGGWATDGRLRTDATELEANARLIASAPDLLIALKESLAEVERLRSAMFAAYCVAANGGSKIEMLAAVERERDAYEAGYSCDMARTAIAKATGAQP